ncbi:hypothetical protein SAMN05660866_01039 [Maribacter arcticus]|uniref:Uncharacterized protein n=1 Tax=Maribacter arcticus TaxID=561365 RepID=A0A1T5AJT7_9FLAO|nr:hypothetical protein SAMN05660866_01039 [Maribacter arcticus]
MKKILLALVLLVATLGCSKSGDEDCSCENIRGYKICVGNDWGWDLDEYRELASDKELTLMQQRSPCN